jgi:hypothetical protein
MPEDEQAQHFGQYVHDPGPNNQLADSEKYFLRDHIWCTRLPLRSSSVSRQAPEQWLRAARRVWTVIKT